MGEPAKEFVQVEINPDDLEPTIGIDLTAQKRILRMEASLGRLADHELLGLGQKPSKKEIRSAYFARMTEFHADRFFGKRLGSFGARLTKITDRLTAAQGRLTQEARQRKKQQSSGSTSEEPTPASKPTPSMPFAEDRASGLRIKAAPVFQPDAPQSAPESPRTKPRAASRRNLAKRLGSSAAVSASNRRESATAPVQDAPAPPRQVTPAVASAMKARYLSRRDPKQSFAQRHRARAEQHLEREEWKAALSAIGLAAEHAPHDAALQQRKAEIEDLAYNGLAPELIFHAEKAKLRGNVEAAARMLERAARGQRSARLYAQAAGWLIELTHLNQSMCRQLVHLSKRAVELDGAQVDYRLMLARAYVSAGMAASAVGEAKRALQLDPNNAEARELLHSTK